MCVKLSRLGICGLLSLISYTLSVVLSPLAYPGYDWLSMAVSDLSAVGAPSAELNKQLGAFFDPCGIVCIMAVCVAVAGCRSKILKWGVFAFAAMEWVMEVGYKLFPWVKDGTMSHPQNVMHLVVTVLVIVFSLAALIFVGIGARKEGISSLSNWAWICLAAMLIGPMGTAFLPKAVFGLFERFSTFSAVIFNAVLGWYLFREKLGGQNIE